MLVQIDQLPTFVCVLPEYAQTEPGVASEARIAQVATFLGDRGIRLVAAGGIHDDTTKRLVEIYLVCEHGVHSWDHIARLLAHLIPTRSAQVPEQPIENPHDFE